MPERHRAYLRAVTRSAFSALIAMLALAAVTVPASAQACWDGYRATTDRVAFQRGTGRASWNPEHARYATRWAARLEALLPESASLEVSNTLTSCHGHLGCLRLAEDIGSDDAATLFDRVADAFAVSPSTRSAALSVSPTVYTVQLFAGSRRAARALRAELLKRSELADLRLPSDSDFFEEGGFPAVNANIHAVADAHDTTLVRVVVGTFQSITDAEMARDALGKQQLPGIVKELPTGTPLDERVTTNEG